MGEIKDYLLEAVNEWHENRRVAVIGRIPEFMISQAKEDNEKYELMLKFIEDNCKDG